MEGALAELAGLERLVAQTEERAARVRQHAAEARHQAGRETARDEEDAAMLRRHEAEAHDRAATIIENTAAVYRHREHGCGLPSSRTRLRSTVEKSRGLAVWRAAEVESQTIGCACWRWGPTGNVMSWHGRENEVQELFRRAAVAHTRVPDPRRPPESSARAATNHSSPAQEAAGTQPKRTMTG